MACLDDVRAQGFDERFLRTWEYYLAASEADFLTRNTGGLQIVFEKPARRSTPALARERMHDGEASTV